VGGPRLGRWTAACALAAAAVFWLAFAVRVVDPLVLSDEYNFYISGIDLPNLGYLYAVSPNLNRFAVFLYLWVIHAVSVLHLPVSAGVRVVSVAGWAAATGLLILRGGRIADGRRSWALIALLLVYPTASYATYIMPESLYFAVFGALFALLLARSGAGGLYRIWLAGGAILAVLTSLKPHGVLLFIAFELATIGWQALTGGVRLRKAAGLTAAAAAAYAASLAVIVLLTTPSGLPHSANVFGPTYTTLIKNSLIAAPWPAIARLTAIYASAVLALFAPTIAFLGARLWSLRRIGTQADRAVLMGSFAALFGLLSLAMLVVAVPALLIVDGNRIYLRYMDFLFPCLLALSWRLSAADPAETKPALRWAMAALWCLSGLALILWLPQLRPLPVDAPELFFTYSSGEFGGFGLGVTVRAFIVLAILSGSALILARRINWLHVQTGVLIAFSVISVWNIGAVQAYWADASAPGRHLGKEARVQCGGARGDIVGLSTPDKFFELYVPLYTVRRAVPLTLMYPADGMKALMATAPGHCVITTLTAPPGTLSVLSAYHDVTLSRAPARRP
jgi:hypothetical protein